ncbi:hypothetical protein ACEPAF_276 [Sanghuangporus sanghuang]
MADELKALLNIISSSINNISAAYPTYPKRTKHENTKGMSALVGYGADECIKSGSYLVEHDRGTFEFFDRPTEEYCRKRCATVVAGANRTHIPASILSGFDWACLPDRGIVVDVGGGLGHVALEIAKANPSLQIVIEDRQLVVEQAVTVNNSPSHVSENKVHFLGANCFEEQPRLPGTVDIFLL